MIRGVRDDDVASLHDIEARASRLFAEHGFPLVGAEPSPVEDFATFLRTNSTLVAAEATDRPTGFAVAGRVGDLWWLKELSVAPEQMGRRIGTALIEAVAVQGRAAGYRRLGLSTFRDVPFNAPFYARRGFSITNPENLSETCRRRFETEVPEGATMDDRVVMIREMCT